MDEIESAGGGSGFQLLWPPSMNSAQALASSASVQTICAADGERSRA
jgi:hypothetical protein